jgi:hypothetical protein
MKEPSAQGHESCAARIFPPRRNLRFNASGLKNAGRAVCAGTLTTMPLPGIQPAPAGIHLRPLLPDSTAPRVTVAVSAETPRQLIRLRETPLAEVFAGALLDAEGAVLQWLEIWTQRRRLSAFFQLGTARALPPEESDARWAELVRGFAETDRARLLITGLEEAPFPPLGWDSGGNPVQPGDEAALTFNPGGGHLLFRFASGWHAAEMSAALSSGQLPSAGPRLSQTHTPEVNDVRHQPGYYLRAWQGEVPPLAEILHLKLTLLYGMVTAAEAATRARRLPLLNVKTRSFGVEASGDRSGLAFWSLQPVMDLPSAAFRFVQSDDAAEPVVLLAEEPPPGIYRHSAVSAPRFVQGNLRLSRVQPAGSRKDLLEAEATLLLHEPLPGPADTLILHCPLAAHPIQASVVALESTRGEAVLRTARWQPLPSLAASLSSGGQAPPPMDCACAIVPRLSSPADLYSLGVAGLEVLCCGSGQSLPQVLDEALRLAQRLTQEKVTVDSIPDTIAAWQRREADANWTSVLSPRHLSCPVADADTGARGVLPLAWCSALTWCLRLLTGSGSAAYFQHPGEGSMQAPHQAYELPLRDLRQLLQRTRALVTLEWKTNLEIRDHILAALEK